MKPIKLIIKTNSEKYPIFIGKNLITKISSLMVNNSIKSKKCLLVVDRKVPKKFISEIKKKLRNKKIFLFNFNANEKNKNQTTINSILEILLNKNFSREDSLLAIGGGITGDVGGFAASLFKRGLHFVNIPTTLLAQVDSSIGGKTGVNSKYGKNLIGSFYQPKLVISDIDTLKTLNRREIVCGYGEILKHSIISKKKFFKYLDQNFDDIIKLKSPYIEKAIFESCKIKKDVVEKDEKESNLRKKLNFGHTFGHSFEASLGYSKRLNHGEAVILGMMMALKFSNKNKFLNSNDYKLVSAHYKNSKLPSDIKKYFKSKDVNKIIKFMKTDKKNNSDKIKLVLLKKMGQTILNQEYSVKNLNGFLKNELID